MAFEDDQIVSSPQSSVQSFVDTYRPIAEKAGKDLNVDPGILLSQWGHETGWGKSIIPGTYNLGNIKDISGKGVSATDPITKSKDSYMKFEDPDTFGVYYSDYIKRKFPKAVGAGSDLNKFSSGLKGYAEDPEYSSKLESAYKQVGSSNVSTDDHFAQDEVVQDTNPFAKDEAVDQPKVSTGKAFGKSLAGGAAEAIAAAPAMALGAEIGGSTGALLGGPFAPITGLAGTIIGGAAGYIAGEKGVEEAYSKLVPDAIKKKIGFDPETRAKELQQQPEASYQGSLLSNLVLFRPGALEEVLLKNGRTISPLMQRIGMGGITGTVETAQEALSNDPMNPAHIAESVAFGGIAAKPTKYMEKVGSLWESPADSFKRNSEDYKDSRIMDPTDPTNRVSKWKVPETTAEGVPITVGKVVDANGNQAVQKDGKPTIARHFRNEDGSSKGIVLDLDEALKRWEDKPWVKSGLDENAFKTPYEYAQFILKHEEEHSRLPFAEWKKLQDPQGDLFKQDDTGIYSEENLRKQYEHYINRQAYHSIQEDPYISQPDVFVPKMPDNAADNPKWLADAFYSLDKNAERDAAIYRIVAEKAMKEDGVDLNMKNKWKAFDEGIGQLDPREKELYNKYIAPDKQERFNLIKYAQDKGWSIPTELNEEISGKNVPRILKPKEQNKLKQILKMLSEGKYGGFQPDIQARPGAAKERTFFVGETSTGKRIVLQGPDKFNRIWRWKDGKAEVFTTLMPGEEYAAGKTLRDMSIKEARDAEIEQHTPYTYEKDYQGVLYQRNAELKDFIRANQFLEDLTKNRSWMEENAFKTEPGKEMPTDFRRPKDLDRVPQLDGYAFKEPYASIIEDFARVNDMNALTWMSGAMIKAMMINPLPHMLNEGWHLYNARGLTGWVTPAGIYRFARTGMPALRSVITQDAEYLETMKLGGSMLSSQVRNSAFMENLFDKANKEFAKTPEFKDLAKSWAMKPIDAFNTLSKKANMAMWTVRDMMYMQLVNENMMYNNMSRAEAIKEVERHMPNYRIPHKVMGSRAMSEVLQNPNVTVFSRYHYGLVNSLKETAKDLAALRQGQAGVKDFLHGADTAAAIAVAIGVLYPLQDQIAQYLTGNKDATVRRAGPFHVFHALHGLATLDKDPMAVISSFFTFNPALLAGAQLIFDRQLYNGQPIYHPEDSPAKITDDIKNYVLKQHPLIGQEMKAETEGDEGFKNWLARQLDIESPTKKTVMQRKKYQQQRKVAGIHRTGKWLMKKNQESKKTDDFEKDEVVK
jgi:hypothetical protein